MRSIIASLVLAGAASAHTIFQQIGINGVMQTRRDFMRLPTYDGVSFFLLLLPLFLLFLSSFSFFSFFLLFAFHSGANH